MPTVTSFQDNTNRQVSGNEIKTIHHCSFDVVEEVPNIPYWLFAGYGQSRTTTAPQDELNSIEKELQLPNTHLLAEWPSTGISGNDLLSSCLFSAGIVASKAGKVAPLANILVAFVMYLFRFVYVEVVSAIPLNGGSYNTLLNTTSKRIAALIAALAIMAYVATGVVGAVSASDYLRGQIPSLNHVHSSICILVVFAVLNIIGIAESAVIALLIFTIHIITLSILIVASIHYTIQQPDIFTTNMNTTFPQVNYCGELIQGNFVTAIFFGFSSAMLGVTGFETAANFVEEQKTGIFKNILRNMWVLSTFFNIALAILNLCVLPLFGENGTIKNNDIVLALMARETVGHWFELWVTVDGFVVLSGSVLTSYVGMTGLIRRLAYDRVMPAFLLKVNTYRRTNHYIILGYCCIASSLVLALKGDIVMLANVFSYSFLSLLVIFSFGAIMFKVKRSEMPRSSSAPWWMCIVGFVMVLIGLFGTLLGDPKVSVVFILYFILVASIIMIMLERLFILHVCMFVLKQICPSKYQSKSKELNQTLLHHKRATNSTTGSYSNHHSNIAHNASVSYETEPLIITGSSSNIEYHTGARGGKTILRMIQSINKPRIIFFLKQANLNILNKAILYVRRNEHTDNLVIMHIHAIGSPLQQDVKNMVFMFDQMYPKLRIDFVSIQGEFNLAMVKWISKKEQIATNMMFIKQPDQVYAHQVTKLGVRVITG